MRVLHYLSSLFQALVAWEGRLSDIKFRSLKTRRLKKTQPFKEGWILTIRAVSALVSDLFMDEDISFVLTRRLNQDPVEVTIILCAS